MRRGERNELLLRLPKQIYSSYCLGSSSCPSSPAEPGKDCRAPKTPKASTLSSHDLGMGWPGPCWGSDMWERIWELPRAQKGPAQGLEQGGPGSKGS